MKMTARSFYSYVPCALLILATACGDPEGEAEHDHDHDEQEVLTSILLTFTPDGGGDAVLAEFRDVDGDGGDDPIIVDPTLMANTTYDVSVSILNETLDPSDEDYNIDREIEAEAEEHQLFYTGDGIEDGLFTWMTTDRESDYTENSGEDLPVGLSGVLTTGDAGRGKLTVTLMHQPPVNGMAVKTTTSGVGDGEVDVTVTFDVTVE